jgi:type IV pilus assembly protein PilN
MTPEVLDVLREKRRAMGQSSLLPDLAVRRQNLLLGAVIGASLVGVTALITTGLALRMVFLKAQVAQLENVEIEVTNLRNRLKGQQARVDRLKTMNKELSRSLTTVQASSVLLSELQVRTPDGIQLTSASAQNSRLVLKGRAIEPDAFTRINALELDLRNSPLLQADKVTVEKAERIQPDQRRSPSTRGGPFISPVEFEITGPFASLTPAEQLSLLRRHGSAGMESRLQLLQKEGLLP